MASVILDYSRFNPETKSIDQSDYIGDNIIARCPGTAPGTLNVTNSTNSEGALQVSPVMGSGSTFNLNLETNSHVKIDSPKVSWDRTYNYKLGENSTLEYNIRGQSTTQFDQASFDFGDSTNSTLIFSHSDNTSLDAAFKYPPKISGLSAGDQIQVQGATQGSLEGNDLVFRDANDVIVGRFDASGQDLSKVTFDGGNMVYACYLKGTHIATPAGEVQVETLKAGDKVLTATGGVATVKWLGHRTLHKSRIPAKDAVRAFPILFKKDSIANNVPHRDLTLSPGHHVSFDGTLVPAMMLVNGQTIVQQFNTKVFEYFHVELEQFDIMLAEGVPAESYVDTGNRSMFQNAADVAMNPDFGPAEGRPEVQGIKVVQQGPVVEAIRKQLLARAQALTGAVLTTDAALCIEVNGQIVQSTPEFGKEGVYHFALPANAGDVRVLSRSAVVRDVTPLARRDVRQIGIGLSGIVVSTASGRQQISLTDAALTGLNAAQGVKGTTMRWTNGAAVLPAALINTTGAATLELTVLRTYTYWIAKDSDSNRHAA